MTEITFHIPWYWQAAWVALIIACIVVAIVAAWQLTKDD